MEQSILLSNRLVTEIHGKIFQHMPILYIRARPILTSYFYSSLHLLSSLHFTRRLAPWR